MSHEENKNVIEFLDEQAFYYDEEDEQWFKEKDDQWTKNIPYVHFNLYRIKITSLSRLTSCGFQIKTYSITISP